MASKADLEKIKNIMDRGTVEVLVKKDLEAKLLSGKKLTVKFGIDPSGKDLHIGHMVPIRKLREFQELGHKIVMLFGNFTGQIGDPTGKGETRAVKTQEELEANAKHYLLQVKTLLDTKNIEVVWNADWLKKLNFADVTHLASHFTVAQMMERDMFQDRVKANKPISVHEFLYPLMQGYDSVSLKADVEIGGTDQTFNLLAGRTLQKAYDQRPQDVITVPILEGLDGKIKMGKSEDNYIGVNEPANEMFGKVMSIPDELILKYFELATDTSLEEITKIEKSLKEGENPRNVKLLLASAVVTIYHDSKAASAAEKEFINVFSKKQTPDEIETKNIGQNSSNIVELLSSTGLSSSKSEARRLIEQGGVKIDNEKVGTVDEMVDLKNERLIQVGKRKFLKVIS
ncbi:tyrosine--tRNA ligase [Pseudomonadota bacterium]